MRRLGLRHMPVVDGAGRPAGMLDLHEALAAASATMVAQIDRLTQESSIEGLAHTKQAQAELASELLADNLPAPDIQALITDINQDLHRRVLEAVLATMAGEGWGAPPVALHAADHGVGRARRELPVPRPGQRLHPRRLPGCRAQPRRCLLHRAGGALHARPRQGRLPALQGQRHGQQSALAQDRDAVARAVPHTGPSGAARSRCSSPTSFSTSARSRGRPSRPRRCARR